jgi:hypothetical protein
MANIIRIKRGSGKPASLLTGELALDTTNRRLYIQTGSASSDIKEAALLENDNTFIGTNTFRPSTDSSTAFVIQRASGSNVFQVDTVNNSVVIGVDSTAKAYLTGKFAVGYTGTLPTLHSYLQLNGSTAFPIATTSSDLTLTDAHYMVLVDASGGSKTITLPISDDVVGRIYVVKKIDGSLNSVVIRAQFDDTIEGGTSISLQSYGDTVILQASDNGWYTVKPLSGSSIRPFVIQSFAPKPPGINDYIVPYAKAGTAATTLALTASRIYWIPFIVWSSVSITGIAINVTTAATGTVYVGIYNSNSRYQPYSLLTSTSFNSGTTGLKSATLSLTLLPNVYWMALVSTAAPTIRAVALAASFSLALPTLGTANTTCWYTSGTSLPSTAPTSGYTALNGSAVPAVGLLYSFV